MIKGKMRRHGKITIPIGGKSNMTAADMVSHILELNPKYTGLEINKVWVDEGAAPVVPAWYQVRKERES